MLVSRVGLGDTLPTTGLRGYQCSVAKLADPQPRHDRLALAPHLEARIEARYRYTVSFVDDVFAPSNPALVRAIALSSGRRPSVLVFVDDGVVQAQPTLCRAIEDYFAAWPQQVQLATLPIVVPGGERCKQGWAAIEPLFAQVHAHGLDRHDTVVAIGGGAVLDAAGFVAATAHRGLRHVRVPTTVLSQNDSGVGVKNAINLFGCKNFVGTFAPPTAVLNDVTLLATLEARDRRAGMAEAVKVAAIRDAEFFAWLETHAADLERFESHAVAHSIRWSAKLHLDHICQSGDPFESGNARPLDFGHWAAHKLESLTDHALRHGEAVAIGMAVDTAYAAAVGLATPEVEARMLAVLRDLGLPVGHAQLGSRDSAGRLRVLDGLEEFRQHLGGKLSLTMLESIGHGVQVHAVELEVLDRICASMAQ